jgi:hypothetical protein
MMTSQMERDMNTNEHKVTRLNVEHVASVYSGRNGKCCCGCAGKHSYASRHRFWASSNRGYAVDSNEVSDRSVKTIVNKMMKAGNMKLSRSGDHVYTVVDNRLYVAYFAMPKSRHRA